MTPGLCPKSAIKAQNADKSACRTENRRWLSAVAGQNRETREIFSAACYSYCVIKWAHLLIVSLATWAAVEFARHEASYCDPHGGDRILDVPLRANRGLRGAGKLWVAQPF